MTLLLLLRGVQYDRLATASITEGDDTLSATAAVAIAGTLSATEGDDTLSSAAQLKIAAVLATTEDNDTLVAAFTIVSLDPSTASRAPLYLPATSTGRLASIWKGMRGT